MNDRISISYYDAPIGKLLLAAGRDALTGLWTEGQKYYPYELSKTAVRDDANPILMQARDWLDRYFAGARPEIPELKLSPAGSPFQQEVWLILCRIPYGHLTTYGSIAKELAAKKGLASMSAQAVGGAVGRNPISIIIPCHRVVGANGCLTGYAGGLERKKQLLALEAASGGIPEGGVLQ